MALETNRGAAEPAMTEMSSIPTEGAPSMDALRSVLADWELPSNTSVHRICESENTTFLAVTPENRRAVLRVHRAGYNDAAEIRSEHAWIDALRQGGRIVTPSVLRRRDGETVGSVMAGGVERSVAAFEFMSGQEPAVDGDLPAWFGRLGELTARFHLHSRAWQRPPGFRRKIWNFETTLGGRPHWGDWRDALGLDGVGASLLTKAVAEIDTRLGAYGTGPERFGLIHADLRLTNLLVEDERLGVIDFDDCGFGWFMYDFAASISFIEHEPIVDELRQAWAESYRMVAPLSAEDESILDVMVMLRRTLLTAWIASRPASDAAKTLGAPFTQGTLELAERFLSRLPSLTNRSLHKTARQG